MKATRFKPKFNIRKGDQVVVIAGDDKDPKKPHTVKQVLVDEVVESAIEHGLGVTGLVLGPVVLDELVRMEDVAADLTAEPNLLLRAADLLQLRLVLFHLDVVEARLQHAHRRVAVAVLRSLVLARHDHAGRQVRDADRGIGDVHVLPARAARSVRVDSQILFFDLA